MLFQDIRTMRWISKSYKPCHCREGLAEIHRSTDALGSMCKPDFRWWLRTAATRITRNEDSQLVCWRRSNANRRVALQNIPSMVQRASSNAPGLIVKSGRSRNWDKNPEHSAMCRTKKVNKSRLHMHPARYPLCTSIGRGH